MIKLFNVFKGQDRRTFHVDTIGRDILIGDDVLWSSSGKAGFHRDRVKAATNTKVRLEAGALVDPKHVVVVT